MPFSELKHRLDMVRKGIRRVRMVEIKNESPRESYFQAFLSRGDRRCGEVLLEMQQQGTDWRWLVKNGRERILPSVPEADYYVHRMIEASETLPWEIVDFLIKRELLERQYLRTFSEDVDPLIARARLKISTESAGCESQLT